MISGIRAVSTLLLVVFVGACGGASEPMPSSLVGLWSTDDDEYSDRAFEITESRIFIQTGDNSYTAYDIERVLKATAIGAYEIEYAVEGATAQFNVTLSGDRVFLTNQPDILWSRGGTYDAPWST